MKTQFLAWIGTAFIGMTGVAVFLKKYGTQIVRGIQVARDALDLLDDLIEASKDEKITPEEIAKFQDTVNKLRQHLQGGTKK